MHCPKCGHKISGLKSETFLKNNFLSSIPLLSFILSVFILILMMSDILTISVKTEKNTKPGKLSFSIQSAINTGESVSDFVEPHIRELENSFFSAIVPDKISKITGIYNKITMFKSIFSISFFLILTLLTTYIFLLFIKSRYCQPAGQLVFFIILCSSAVLIASTKYISAKLPDLAAWNFYNIQYSFTINTNYKIYIIMLLSVINFSLATISGKSKNKKPDFF